MRSRLIGCKTKMGGTCEESHVATHNYSFKRLVESKNIKAIPFRHDIFYLPSL